MQRWAGVTDSAACFERQTINPMLDRRFLDVARAGSSREARVGRFLGRLQVALDQPLAKMPLEGRPPPEVFAQIGREERVDTGIARRRRGTNKVRQRIHGTAKPAPARPFSVAKVLEHSAASP